MAGEGDRPGGGPEATGRRLTVAEAAEALGITAEAVRSRIKRGSLQTLREDGTVYVVGGGADRAQPVGDRSRQGAAPEPDRADRDALVDVLKEQNEYLREQLRREQEANAESRRLLAAALERIPATDTGYRSPPRRPQNRPRPPRRGRQGLSPTPLRGGAGGRTAALVA